MVSKEERENKLALIPKAEKYIEYMLDVMIKLPRTEKFSIGTEYKQSMYQMLREIMLLNKTKNTYKLKDNTKLKIESTEKNNKDNLEKQNEYKKYLKEMINILNIIDSQLNNEE